jgi:hypothetical protein
MAKANKQQNPPPVFDEFQQIVADSYVGGEFAGHSLAYIDDCGDTLFAFLMTELSVKEDCSGFEEAISRLDTAIRELNEVRGAFESRLKDLPPPDRFTEILQHRIKFWLRGDKAPAELDESSIEHLKRLIDEGYNQGELCLLGDDGDTEYRGWWNIEPRESA